MRGYRTSIYYIEMKVGDLTLMLYCMLIANYH